MAFNMAYTNANTGVTANYYKIFEMAVDPINNVTECTLGVYVDQGAQPIDSWNFTYFGVLTAAQAEANIMQRDEFSSAVEI